VESGLDRIHPGADGGSPGGRRGGTKALLAVMRERAELLGGTLETGGRDGRFRVRLRVRVSAAAE
jgi:signal transduction histidine kinase